MNELINIFEVLNVSAFARSIGMNESLLRKYKSGIVKPSEKQLTRIKTRIRELGNKLIKTKLHYEN